MTDRLHPDLIPMRKLWCSVIAQACMDSRNQVSESILPQCDKDRAITWLRGNTRDFYHVCDLAGINPEKLRRFKTGGKPISNYLTYDL